MDVFDDFVGALWERHAADLSFQELRRAVQAVSSVYVERRGRTGTGAALTSRGKRAAFATYFGALHLLTAAEVIGRLDAASGLKGTIVDLGCGTGVVGAAWATLTSGRAQLVGVERNSWAVREARWTIDALGVRGSARRGDATRFRLPQDTRAVVAGYLVNEVDEKGRQRLLETFVRASRHNVRVLVLEPIAKRALPWWPTWAAAFRALGGREDLWRLPVTLAPHLRDLDRAAGLNHDELKARSLYIR